MTPTETATPVASLPATTTTADDGSDGGPGAALATLAILAAAAGGYALWSRRTPRVR